MSDLARPSRSVALDGAARRAATRLSAFYAGLDAARSSAVHLTALGHSYGSLVIGHAHRPGTPVDDVAVFGGDPNRLDGVVGLSARDSAVDGRPLRESTGHSSYLVPGTTSQYAIAAGVAGHADRAPRDDGTGLGDWLTAPPHQWLP